jgi:hypothetical protein
MTAWPSCKRRAGRLPGPDAGSAGGRAQAAGAAAERLLFTPEQYGTGGLNRQNSGGLFVVSRDGSGQRQLFQTAQQWFNTGARRHVYFTPVRKVPGKQR